MSIWNEKKFSVFSTFFLVFTSVACTLVCLCFIIKKHQHVHTPKRMYTTLGWKKECLGGQHVADLHSGCVSIYLQLSGWNIKASGYSYIYLYIFFSFSPYWECVCMNACSLACVRISAWSQRKRGVWPPDFSPSRAHPPSPFSPTSWASAACMQKAPAALVDCGAVPCRALCVTLYGLE